jgi:hypothetical protein
MESCGDSATERKFTDSQTLAARALFPDRVEFTCSSRGGDPLAEGNIPQPGSSNLSDVRNLIWPRVCVLIHCGRDAVMTHQGSPPTPVINGRLQ